MDTEGRRDVSAFEHDRVIIQGIAEEVKPYGTRF
jgi:hypothetical protein